MSERQPFNPERVQPRERDASKEMQKHLQDLLHAGLPLEDIADTLGAEAFLREERDRTGSLVKTFDVAAFVKRCAENDQLLKLPEDISRTREIVLPPGEGEVLHGDGSGVEEKGHVPRTKYLIEVLTDLDTPYSVIRGSVTEEMMRKEPYQIFLLPDKGKIVFVNNEAQNATFVLHNIEDVVAELQKANGLTKQEILDVYADSGVDSVWFRDEVQWKEGMRTVLDRRDVKKAPEGWQHDGRYLRAELRASSANIRRAAEKYREEHPEWFDHFVVAVTGEMKEHFAPELIEHLKSDLESDVESAPEGWLSLKALSEALGASEKTVKKTVGTFINEHPDWQGRYRARRSGVTEFFHPDVHPELQKHFEHISKIPEGWVTAQQLADELGKGFSLIKARSTKAQQDHPEWFQVRRNAETGNQIAIIAPEFADLLREEYLGRERPPDGWLSISQVRSQLGVHIRKVREHWDVLREEFPEQFGEYADIQGREGVFCSPAVVEAIRAELAVEKRKNGP